MKLSRNDTCPCESGQKYKKCCLNTPYNQEIVRAMSLVSTREHLKEELLKPIQIFEFKASIFIEKKRFIEHLHYQEI